MEVVGGLLVALIFFVLYFVPTIIAFKREHHNRWAIAALNFFLGATCFGWVASLVWSLTVVKRFD